MFFRLICSGFAILFFLASCSKNDGNGNGAKDNTAPSIVIVSPMNNQQFTAGQTIQITANATDNVKVTELHVHVSDKATGVLLRDIHSYPGTTAATVQDSFAAQAGPGYVIKIIALDPSQNLSTAEVEVSVN